MKAPFVKNILTTKLKEEIKTIEQWEERDKKGETAQSVKEKENGLIRIEELTEVLKYLNT